jgi:Predicted ferric reductase
MAKTNKTNAQKTAGLKVVKVAPENHDTTSIYFTGPDMERFKKREAGQFASIRVFRNGVWTEPHPFTLSSSPEDETLCMTIKKSGAFTNTIPEIEPGTPIECAGPFGQFCHGIEDQREIVMIAGGVGITPFLSVLRHFKEIGADNDIMLFWANKTYADAFAAQELEDYTTILRLHVVHVLSRVEPQNRKSAPVFTDARPGRVSFEYGRISQELLRRHIVTTNAAFYLCGPPAMQQTVLDELAKCGVDPQGVRKEAFVFKSAPKKDVAE